MIALLGAPKRFSIAVSKFIHHMVFIDGSALQIRPPSAEHQIALFIQ